ncbi:peptidase inhibitor family I36 protein [Streptomyces odonnellii]|uniref:peptidase inhibitor family I36 protein n=1 Tax=Streptomyces odonnellii TaxID=1417980 RepID=UPI0006254DC2|nr:peptidase inhibitor family I36 protein [Streptomyces odonnellii]
MNRLIRRSLSLTAAAACGVLMGMVPADTAGALSAWDCKDERVCLYEDTQGGGANLQVHDAIADLSNQGWNDRARSVRSRASVTWCLYRDENYQGESREIDEGEQIDLPGHFDQTVSSMRPKPSGGAC